jgi:hypothetical protein
MAPINSEATAWLAAAGRVPMLTPAEEVHLGGLVRRWQDWEPSPAEAPPAVARRGIRARNRIVAANLRLVAMVVSRIGGDGLLVDRLQNGAIGLVRAAEKFDPSRGYKFSTYSYLWIRQAIDAGELAETTIRLPQPVAAAVKGRRNGHCSPACLEAGLAAVVGVLSLDRPVSGLSCFSDGDIDLANVLAAPAEPGLLELAHVEALQVALAAMRAAEPDSMALLDLFHQEGHQITVLADLVGTGHHAAKVSMGAAADRMRSLPEVQVVLAELVA